MAGATICNATHSFKNNAAVSFRVANKQEADQERVVHDGLDARVAVARVNDTPDGLVQETKIVIGVAMRNVGVNGPQLKRIFTMFSLIQTAMVMR
jgi:hypothetical protein